MWNLKTRDMQTPSDLFLDLINPVKHHYTKQIWGAVIRMFPRHKQLRLCSTCSKQQPSSLVSWDLPPHCHSSTESLWVNTWVRVRLCARVYEVCASMCACVHVYACILMQHIQVWKNVLAYSHWQYSISYGIGPSALAAREFILSFVHMPNSKVTTDYLYIFHNIHTHLLEKLQYVFSNRSIISSKNAPIIRFTH